MYLKRCSSWNNWTSVFMAFLISTNHISPCDRYDKKQVGCLLLDTEVEGGEGVNDTEYM